MRKILKITLIIVGSILLGCFAYMIFLNYIFAREALFVSQPEVELVDNRTNREKRFCDSLKNLYYRDVSITKLIYFKEDKNKVGYCYQLSYDTGKHIRKMYFDSLIDQHVYTNSQLDSIDKENISLLINLLVKYTSNRIIYENESYEVSYSDDFTKHIDKVDLQKMCGFKVIKTGKYKYKRFYMRPKDTPLQLFIPKRWLKYRNLNEKHLYIDSL